MLRVSASMCALSFCLLELPRTSLCQVPRWYKRREKRAHFCSLTRHFTAINTTQVTKLKRHTRKLLFWVVSMHVHLRESAKTFSFILIPTACINTEAHVKLLHDCITLKILKKTMTSKMFIHLFSIPASSFLGLVDLEFIPAVIRW